MNKQLILSHEVEPLQVVKIVTFAGKGLPFLEDFSSLCPPSCHLPECLYLNLLLNCCN